MDNVNHPKHYMQGGAVECIDAIEAAVQGLSGSEAYCIGNAIKYLWRWKFKGGAEDLKKAKWYIDRTLESLAAEFHRKMASSLLPVQRRLTRQPLWAAQCLASALCLPSWSAKPYKIG
jgi:hypothetical protein